MKVRYRPQFWHDVEDGVAYLAQHGSVKVARRWHSEVMAAVDLVQKLPAGRPRPDLKPAGIRSFILRRFPRYLLFYRWKREAVEVLRIKHLDKVT